MKSAVIFHDFSKAPLAIYKDAGLYFDVMSLIPPDDESLDETHA